ncbi:DNA-binding protein [Achromobacter seleniivolatilans]|uniref:DNA-binding protein n=1 Tax=Achromobacter seleniivolatilans TaxID=3047478 RepID=A0ABY9M502_9BURK|nr:DNA-binding protein [Achromobacter sp. R39]WMD22074.1 DNA-binding protein [Achromobacter sp. R39]
MATGITETDVWTAADALLLEGARPTIERVRQKIGRGSPNTVSPHLETWFRALGARIKDPGAFAAAPAIPDPITLAATHLWETALAEARAEQAASYRQRWQELAEEGERLATDAEQLQQREIQLEHRAQDLQEGLRIATAQLAATEDRLRAAELQLRQRDEQLKQSQVALEDARSAVQTLLTEAEKMRSLHAQALEAQESRHASHERRWLNELDGERTAAKKLQLRIDEAQIANQRQVAQLQTSLSDAQDGKRAAEQGAQALRNEAGAKQAQYEASLATANATVVSAQQREQALDARLAASDAQVAAALAQLRQKDEQVDALTRHLMALAQQERAASAAAQHPPGAA